MNEIELYSRQKINAFHLQLTAEVFTKNNKIEKVALLSKFRILEKQESSVMTT